MFIPLPGSPILMTASHGKLFSGTWQPSHGRFVSLSTGVVVTMQFPNQNFPHCSPEKKWRNLHSTIVKLIKNEAAVYA